MHVLFSPDLHRDPKENYINVLMEGIAVHTVPDFPVLSVPHPQINTSKTLILQRYR